MLAALGIPTEFTDTRPLLLNKWGQQGAVGVRQSLSLWVCQTTILVGDEIAGEIITSQLLARVGWGRQIAMSRCGPNQLVGAPRRGAGRTLRGRGEPQPGKPQGDAGGWHGTWEGPCGGSLCVWRKPGGLEGCSCVFCAVSWHSACFNPGGLECSDHQG